MTVTCPNSDCKRVFTWEQDEEGNVSLPGSNFRELWCQGFVWVCPCGAVVAFGANDELSGDGKLRLYHPVPTSLGNPPEPFVQ